ncbi:MAG: molybdenum transporter [Flavobacteriales bacterium CG_4_9_14_3_um_filter_40_17]|nr:MAG: molybdenum transporter [Flavobacteriales bacterium CG_4_9_14_3_um_filter_40_17]
MELKNYQAKGRIWLETEQDHQLSPGRQKLILAIKEFGFISKVVKKMKISYRHAWEIINELNASSNLPIVEKNSSGSGGGGSKLTESGETLLKQYEQCQNEFEAFKSELNKVE